MKALVLADFVAETDEEISLSKGATVEVVAKEEDGWWHVSTEGRKGLFPGSYLRQLEEEAPPAEPQEAAAPGRGALPTPPGSAAAAPGAAAPAARGRGGGRGALPTPPRGGSPVARGRGSPVARGRGSPAGARGRGRGNRLSMNRGMRMALNRGGPAARGGGRGALPTPPGAEATPQQQEAVAQKEKEPEPELEVRTPEPEPEKDTRLELELPAPAEESGEEGSAASDGEPAPMALPPKTPREKLEKNEAHRRNVIQEIITTETDYCHDLKVVSDVFIKPLRDQQIIQQDDLMQLFSNIELIASVNQEVMKEFEARSDEDSEVLLVGDIFLRMADFFKMYTTYCANQPKSIAALERLQARVPAFNDFLAKCMTAEAARGLTLFSFLIKPIQRICKYPLLLKDLLKHTAPDHPDYENLKNAQVKIEAVVEYVNERKRLAENLQKILDVQEQIDSSGEELLLVAPSRRFVREGHHTVIENGSKKERKAFVFNDVIVLTKPKKNRMGKDQKDHFKAKFFLNDVKIVDIADTELIQNACEVLPKDPTQKYSFVFVFPSAQEKRDWVKEIKLLVREFQKKEAQARKEALARKPEEEEASPGPPRREANGSQSQNYMEMIDKDKAFARPAKPGGRPPSVRLSSSGVVRRVTSSGAAKPAKPAKASKSTTPKLTRKDSKASMKKPAPVSKESRKAVSAALKKQPPGSKVKKSTTSSPLFSLKKKSSKGKGDLFVPKQQKPKFSNELKAKFKSEE